MRLVIHQCGKQRLKDTMNFLLHDYYRVIENTIVSNAVTLHLSYQT